MSKLRNSTEIIEAASNALRYFAQHDDNILASREAARIADELGGLFQPNRFTSSRDSMLWRMS